MKDRHPILTKEGNALREGRMAYKVHFEARDYNNGRGSTSQAFTEET
jgi:hypothetical protein